MITKPFNPRYIEYAPVAPVVPSVNIGVPSDDNSTMGPPAVLTGGLPVLVQPTVLTGPLGDVAGCGCGNLSNKGVNRKIVLFNEKDISDNTIEIQARELNKSCSSAGTSCNNDGTCTMVVFLYDPMTGRWSSPDVVSGRTTGTGGLNAANGSCNINWARWWMQPFPM